MLELTVYISGSIYGILNQNSSITYPKDIAGQAQPIAYQSEERPLTDQEIYERAQRLELPDYISGSIYGILNQNSSITYPKDIAGQAQPIAYQSEERPLTNQEIYER